MWRRYKALLLTIVQDPSGGDKSLNRTWTISSHPSEQTDMTAFTITVKDVGLISGWLHSSFRKGDVLEWRGVGGEFTPQIHSGPALLIAGGIGAARKSHPSTLNSSTDSFHMRAAVLSRALCLKLKITAVPVVMTCLTHTLPRLQELHIQAFIRLRSGP